MKLFFITSFQKSGSNWLRNCLDASDRINVSGEVYPARVIELMEQIGVGDETSRERLTARNTFNRVTVETVINLMQDNFFGDPVPAEILGDKSAYGPSFSTVFRSVRQISLIAKYFPEAKQILLLRDLRDVIVSYSKWPKGRNLIKSNPISFFYFVMFVYQWSAMTKVWCKECSADERCLILRYEDLKIDFKRTIEKAFRHLDISLSTDEISEIEKNLYSINSDLYKRANKGLGYEFYRSGSVGEWKKLLRWYHVWAIKVLAKDALNDSDYELEL